MFKIIKLYLILSVLGCDSKQSNEQACITNFTKNSCIEPIDPIKFCCINKYQIVGTNQCEYLLKIPKPPSEIFFIDAFFIDKNYKLTSCKD